MWMEDRAYLGGESELSDIEEEYVTHPAEMGGRELWEGFGGAVRWFEGIVCIFVEGLSIVK